METATATAEPVKRARPGAGENKAPAKAQATKPVATKTKQKTNAGRPGVEKTAVNAQMVKDLQEYFGLSTHSAIANHLDCPYYVVYGLLTGNEVNVPKTVYEKLNKAVANLHRVSERILKHYAK